MIKTIIDKWQKELKTVGFIDHPKELLIKRFIKDLEKIKKREISGHERIS